MSNTILPDFKKKTDTILARIAIILVYQVNKLDICQAAQKKSLLFGKIEQIFCKGTLFNSQESP